MSTVYINSISFSRLRNAHHIGFHSKFLEEIDKYDYESLGVNDELYARYKSAISIEQDLVNRNRASELTVQMNELDAQRDKIFRHLIYKLKAAVSGDPTETITADIIASLQNKILDLYPVSIADGGAQEETAKLRGLIKDMNLFFSEVLADLGVTSVLASLETANDAYETAFMERIREKAASENTAECRANCDDAFLQLSFYINSSANLVAGSSDTATLVKQKICAKIVEETNELIAYYQSHYYSKATATEEETPAATEENADNAD